MIHEHLDRLNYLTHDISSYGCGDALNEDRKLTADR